MEIYEQKTGSVKPTLQNHMAKTFGWMFIGIAVTFGIAALMNLDQTVIINLYTNFPAIGLVMLFAQLGVVVALVSRVTKMKSSTAKILFLLYSALTGVTFSTLGLVYELGSIGLAFGMSALYFASLAVIGYTTKRDLTKVGTIAMAGLFALIIYSFLSFLFGFSMDSFVYSIIGLLIFAGLTAWDVQKIKKMHDAYQDDEKMLNTLSIYSAFQLYLDFINIFLFILRIVGNRRN